MANRSIPLVGSVGKLGPADAGRLAAYVVRGREVVAQAPVQGNGAFQVNLARSALDSPGPYGLSVVIAPAGAADHLDHITDAPRIALDRAALSRSEKEYRLAAPLTISDAILKKWWKWCFQYCVNGTVVGPN